MELWFFPLFEETPNDWIKLNTISILWKIKIKSLFSIFTYFQTSFIKILVFDHLVLWNNNFFSITMKTHKPVCLWVWVMNKLWLWKYWIDVPQCNAMHKGRDTWNKNRENSVFQNVIVFIFLHRFVRIFFAHFVCFGVGFLDWWNSDFSAWDL